MPEQHEHDTDFRPWRGAAAVAGFVAFGLWFFTAMGGLGEAMQYVACGVLLVGLLCVVFYAFATGDFDD